MKSLASMRRRLITVLVGLVAGVCGLVLYILANPKVESGTHLSRVDWLPPSATDISYVRREGFGWLLTYECTISEVDFRSLAHKEDWTIREAADVPISGLRLSLDLPPPLDPAGTPAQKINKAWVFENRRPNGGGITVIYDRERSRLFFSTSHR